MCEFLFEMRVVNILLKLCEENRKKPNFDPLISFPGVKNDVNNVNISKLPPYFHSSHNFVLTKGFNLEKNVNNKKLARHELGSQC